MAMNETRYFSAPDLQLRNQAGKGRQASGYAAVFNANSHDLGGFVERIAPGAFARSLSEAASGQRSIYALWSHDNSLPLGSTKSGKLTLNEDERGLSFDLDVARFNPMMLSALEDSDLQMSFGFRVREDKWLKIEGDNSDEYERTLIDVELLEISFVTSPAYPDTSAALRSLDSFKQETVQVEEVTPDITEQVKRVLSLRYRLQSGR